MIKFMLIVTIILIIFLIVGIIYLRYLYRKNGYIKLETEISIDILIEREDRYFSDLKYSSIMLIDIYNDLIYQKEVAVKNKWCVQDILYLNNKIKLYKHSLDNFTPSSNSWTESSNPISLFSKVVVISSKRESLSSKLSTDFFLLI